MKTTEEIQKLYDTDLKDNLQSLEKIRTGIRSQILLLILMIFASIILYSVTKSIIIAILAVIGLLVFGFLIVKKKTKYTDDFKNKVVTKIIDMINPEFTYKYDQTIDIGTINRSGLFSTLAERNTGDDLVYGKIEKTEFRFSEINPEYERIDVDEDGHTTRHWESIFKGLFFMADFNKKIESTTYVLPDTAEKLFGKFGQKFQKMSRKGELVKLENPIFEKEFVVYSSSQIEARYILTPTMMETMVNIQKQFGKKFYFSFIDSSVYCAMQNSKAMFEPKIMKSGVKFEDIQEMYSLFSLIEILIHEMNLNTRIWTKE